ncbi:hypothetical protein SDC9_148733 [bioreactor metagenome]|uniref:Uncharacterized protein n=1 Tax=bioreactor metagenome TaxID=1076179 RepID=A0A645ELG7_9ZZZZ
MRGAHFSATAAVAGVLSGRRHRAGRCRIGAGWPALSLRLRQSLDPQTDPVRAGALRRGRRRSQWEFYAGDNRWSKLTQDAVPLFDGAPMLSVHWNEYLGKYLAFYTVPLADRVVCRTADRPEGPRRGTGGALISRVCAAARPCCGPDCAYCSRLRYRH